MNRELQLLREEYITMHGSGWFPHDARMRVEEEAAETFDTVMQKYAHSVAHKAIDRLAAILYESEIRDGNDLVDAIYQARDEIDGRGI